MRLLSQLHTYLSSMPELIRCVGMYMTGNSLQIFSIMMVFMLFKTPITALLGIQATFSRFETEGTKPKMLLVKLVYMLCNGMALALGIWKVNQMGLLPYVYRNTRKLKYRNAHMSSTARHGRIGLLGRRQESLWRGRFLHFLSDVHLNDGLENPKILLILIFLDFIAVSSN